MFEKRLETVVPVPRDHDDPLLVWLTRESFERVAAGQGLVLAEWSDEGELDPEDVPPVAEKQMGRAAKDLAWRHFTGIARRPAVDMDKAG